MNDDTKAVIYALWLAIQDRQGLIDAYADTSRKKEIAEADKDIRRFHKLIQQFELGRLEVK